ncbi:MAG: hypothetical protein M3P26_09410 [Gemmatimonadota bacterium]|nr:hypothetical protein [Gemmatimonadota bacterium]
MVGWKLNAQRQPYLNSFNDEARPMNYFESQDRESLFMKLLDSFGGATMGEGASHGCRKMVYTDEGGSVNRFCGTVESELNGEHAS